MKARREKINITPLITISLYKSFLKLDPVVQFQNPILFIAYIFTLFLTIFFVARPLTVTSLELQLVVWLWITIILANFVEALAFNLGQIHLSTLRQTPSDPFARLLVDGREQLTPASTLCRGDYIVCEVGDTIPADGEVVEGIASVDESAITGESAPVIRESGLDRSAVTKGSVIVSDRIVVLVSSDAGQSFMEQMIQILEGPRRQKTANEISLNLILYALTFIMFVSVVALKYFADYSAEASGAELSQLVSLPVLGALFVCLIPTALTVLLNGVSIAGMDRLIKNNVVVKSPGAVELAGNIDLLLLDKTGTITLGNRMATAFFPVPEVVERDLAEAAQLASLSDTTAEGRSVVVLAKELFDLRAHHLDPTHAHFHPYSAYTRMSGLDLLDGSGAVVKILRKGSVEVIRAHIEALGGLFPAALQPSIDLISHQGGTPLLVSDGPRVLGVIALKDIVKGGIKERCEELRKMGIKTVMITGDNCLTAAAIAAEAGVDDFIAEATPAMKLERIRLEQRSGRAVAMTGDGTNDAPALAQADVGVTMNTGTLASREAGNMLDLDNNPTKLIDIVIVGKQLLMTRGALTIFCISNNFGKYFALLPALFGTLYVSGERPLGPLSQLNFMRLHSPESAILSTVIFNALIVLFLVPLALRGIRYLPHSPTTLFRNNLTIYGLSGFVASFFGIKLIDTVLEIFGMV